MSRTLRSVTAPVSTTAFDLRVEPVDDVLDRVERSLQMRLDRDTMVRKRRSVGARTNRNTWVRIERRHLEKIDGQGWNGSECAALLDGIAKPEWYAGMSWRDTALDVMWRADETEVITAAPITSGGTLTEDPQLPESWWSTLNVSLAALADQHTTRIATPDTLPITQARLTAEINRVFPDRVDTIIDEWVPAHADFNWANLTGPEFYVLDWEDWGLAPKGLDSSTLWGNSILVPAMADRVRRERRADLDSSSGKLMSLFFCTKIVGDSTGYSGPMLEPATREAARLIDELQDHPS